MKTKELVRIGFDHNGCVATCYDREECYFYTIRFIFSSKKEIKYRLRHEYGVIVPKSIIK